MKSYYFISGLPRSGSTLLSAILRQNPNFHADISSVLRLLCESSIEIMSDGNSNFDLKESRRKNILHGLFDAYYCDVDKPIVFDTCREWTRKTHLLKNIFPETKILCTVRDISSILNSFEVISSKNPLYKNRLSNYYHTVFGRCDLLMDSRGTVREALDSLKEGLSASSDMIMLIEYEELTKNPEIIMREVYEFLNIPYFSHNFENVSYSNEGYDSELNLKDLHTIRKKVEYNSPKFIIPDEIVEKYSGLEFWRKPPPSRYIYN